MHLILEVLRYFPWNIHTVDVFFLLCFVYGWLSLVSYHSWLLHWHWSSHAFEVILKKKYVYLSTPYVNALVSDTSNINGLMQKRHKSIANTLEFCLFCIKSSIWQKTNKQTNKKIQKKCGYFIGYTVHALHLTNCSLRDVEIIYKCILNSFYELVFWELPVKFALGECTEAHRWSVKVGSGSGKGLVLSSNKPLPYPILPQICVTILCH